MKKLFRPETVICMNLDLPYKNYSTIKSISHVIFSCLQFEKRKDPCEFWALSDVNFKKHQELFIYDS